MIQQQLNNSTACGSFTVLFLGLALMLSSPCALSSTAKDAPTALLKNGMMPQSGLKQNNKRLEILYICPMHPDEVSKKPGSCSQCGMFLVAQGANRDHSMHKHPVPTTHNGKAIETLTYDVLQHKKMPMPQKTKPVLFWENREPQLNSEPQQDRELQPDKKSQPGGVTMQKRTEPGQNMQPISKRMTPELPKMPVMPKSVMLESPEEHARKHLNPTYICPMHPQIVSTDPDSSCPICGMDLVAKAIGQDTLDLSHDQEAIYICPMHPQIMQDSSGNCPICGMDLVSRENVAATGDHPQVFLSAVVIQNMGVRTATVQRNALSKQIRTQGIVTPDDDRILYIHPRTGGWIETLYPITEGERVERKDVLANFYSPWINQVQLEFISALEEYDLTSFDPSKKTEASAKLDSLRNSLRLLNVMDMDIMRIKNSRKVQNTIQLMAPQGGIITQLRVSEGSYVEPYQSMFTIVDLSQVWVMMDIYEYQAPWIRKGHRVKITAPAIPGRYWGGVVDYIYPEVDPKTRTLRARIEVPNPDEALLLNMFVQVDLSASARKQDVLTVPREAVIVTGEREVVVKSLGKGHFQPVDISTGTWGSHQAEILSGLNEGDEVVVSGQFLIDSESSLQASFLRMMK